jgi:hypothetical protein
MSMSPTITCHKKARLYRAFLGSTCSAAGHGQTVAQWSWWLFDLCFFVDHVFANHRVEFFNFHFFRHGTLVLGGGIKMACTG